MNALMEPLWVAAQLRMDHEVLDPALAELVGAGLVLLGGAVLFAQLAPRDYNLRQARA